MASLGLGWLSTPLGLTLSTLSRDAGSGTDDLLRPYPVSCPGLASVLVVAVPNVCRGSVWSSGHFPSGHLLNSRPACPCPEQPHPPTVQRSPDQRSQAAQTARRAVRSGSGAGSGVGGAARTAGTKSTTSGPIVSRPMPASMVSGSVIPKRRAPSQPLAISQRTRQSMRCRSCAGGQPAAVARSSNGKGAVIVDRNGRQHRRAAAGV